MRSALPLAQQRPQAVLRMRRDHHWFQRKKEGRVGDGCVKLQYHVATVFLLFRINVELSWLFILHELLLKCLSHEKPSSRRRHGKVQTRDL